MRRQPFLEDATPFTAESATAASPSVADGCVRVSIMTAWGLQLNEVM